MDHQSKKRFGLTILPRSPPFSSIFHWVSEKTQSIEQSVRAIPALAESYRRRFSSELFTIAELRLSRTIITAEGAAVDLSAADDAARGRSAGSERMHLRRISNVRE
jgi:hypothetical protein